MSAPNFAPPKLKGPLKASGAITIPKGTKNFELRKTHIRYQGYWAALIDHNEPHDNDVLEDVRIECLPPSSPTDTLTMSKWGIRRYKCAGVRRRVHVSGAWWEHGDYESTGDGDLTYEDCLFENCGAQGLQLRHTGNRADLLWYAPRTLRFTKVRISECGQARGVGRAGFSFTIFDQGPLTDVRIRGLNVRTKDAGVVVTKNGRPYNSFGGALVGYCRTLAWNGGYVGMLNPDRNPVQLYQPEIKDARTSGPENIEIAGVHLDYGNNLAITKHHDTVDIRRMKGDGRILVYERVSPTKWALVENVPLANGYRRGV